MMTSNYPCVQFVEGAVSLADHPFSASCFHLHVVNL